MKWGYTLKERRQNEIGKQKEINCLGIFSFAEIQSDHLVLWSIFVGLKIEEGTIVGNVVIGCIKVVHHLHNV